MAANLNKRLQTGAADPLINKIAAEDPVPWYKKPNLRSLYLLLFPTCMAMELTSGFDGQMVNALQIVPAWQEGKGPPEDYPVHLASLLTPGSLC